MKLMNKEFIRFVLVGGINTANYYLLYLFLLHIGGMPYMVSHLISFLVSMTISFFLNVYFTYRVKPTLSKFLQFPLTQLVNIVVSSALVYVFIEVFHFNSSIAPIVAVFFTVPITFLVTGKILKK
jgi:putative flippase GtrA